VRFVAHRAVKDERGCSACEQRPATGTCGDEFDLSNDGECRTGTTKGKLGECIPLDGPSSFKAVSLSKLGPKNVACPATAPSTPTGAVTLEDPVTFCCNK